MAAIPRQGEHDMEILDWQELGAPILEPLRARERLALWTMPVAAPVERDPLVAAGVALLDVPRAPPCGNARSLMTRRCPRLSAAE